MGRRKLGEARERMEDGRGKRGGVIEEKREDGGRGKIEDLKLRR